MHDQPVGPSNGRPQYYYGHPQQFATKCGHTIHPSAANHTPLCPVCISSEVRIQMGLALKGLIAEGGLTPVHHMRDRRWQRAKLQFDITGQRQGKARSRDQLRAEREHAWDEAHRQLGPQQLRATSAPGSDTQCPICASMVASRPSDSVGLSVEKDVAWWERPGGLVAEHILVPRTPLRSTKRPLEHAQTVKGSSVLRILIQDFRRAMMASNAHRMAWERRYRTESAVRRKHSLGEEYHFEPDFWDAPISACISRRNYQYVRDEQRMQARRARGNTARPRPPRSSLSHAAHTDEVAMDEAVLEEMIRKEEAEKWEQLSRKVGEQVGYLYFVGGDGLSHWREDYLRSDRQLVYRKTAVEITPVDSVADGEYFQDLGLYVNDDCGGDDDEETGDEGGENETYDEMEIDG